jgi:hypothetical protein
MTFLDPLASVLFALRFNLDQYTDWYNSPNAALLFWSVFVAVLLLIVAITLWVFRRMRPH